MNPNLKYKKKKSFFWGEGVARESKFFLTENPNLKKYIFFLFFFFFFFFFGGGGGGGLGGGGGGGG